MKGIIKNERLFITIHETQSQRVRLYQIFCQTPNKICQNSIENPRKM